MRLAALLLCLGAGCGVFRSRTVDAAKETVKSLPDLLDSLKALVAAIQALVSLLAAQLLPKIAHVVDTIDETAHTYHDVGRYLVYFLALGASGGLFSYGKSIIRVAKRLWRKATT